MTYEKDGIRLKIEQDSDPIDPREDSEPLGTMVCWHRRYNLGDKHDFKEPRDFQEWWAEEDGIRLPLYLYDHSGITMSTNKTEPGWYHAAWDSGQVGWIYITNEKIREEYGPNWQRDYGYDKIEKYLKAEVKTYDQWLTGQVYGFTIEKLNKCECCGHEEWEHIDSCWGFYGGDMKENGMMDQIPEEYHYLLEAEVKA